jgi:hypothetical protein
MSMKCAVIGHIYCKKVIAVAKTARSGKISKLIILLWASFDCTLIQKIPLGELADVFMHGSHFKTISLNFVRIIE